MGPPREVRGLGVALAPCNNWTAVHTSTRSQSEASKAAYRGDGRRAWQCILSKSGLAVFPVPGKYLEDGSVGTVTLRNSLGQSPWTHQSPEQDWHDRVISATTLESASCFDQSVIARSLRRLHARKATGPDGIAAEMWRFGGEESLKLLTSVIADCTESLVQAPRKNMQARGFTRLHEVDPSGAMWSGSTWHRLRLRTVRPTGALCIRGVSGPQ